ncbi:MAG: ParA family protein [Acidobacteriia bacterium]|nr:ParA family protein [Terriglobia bacterium]
MIRLVLSNQRGGVAKTTTTHTLARYFADQGLRVLLIDTDPQGSLGAVLGLKPRHYLHQFVVHNYPFQECLFEAYPGIDVLCSNRETALTEQILHGVVGREMVFENLFSKVDREYDVVLIDVAPSISMLQNCALVYARHMLIPVAMDPLSLQGVGANVESSRLLNAAFKLDVRPVAILPVMVDRRLQMTAIVMESLLELAERLNIPVLHAIRVDAMVTKASRARQFLVDYDPRSRAAEDYQIACQELAILLQEQTNERQLQASA